MFTAQQALAAVYQQQTSAQRITPQQIVQLLDGVRGTTFASTVQVTQVKTAAAHREQRIYKATHASLQLFNCLRDATSAYQLAVQRSAARIESNREDAVAQFQPADAYFEHTDTYSLVRHRAQNKFYLYAIYNGAGSHYVQDLRVISKEEVAAYLTPAAARDLLDPPQTVRNVGAGIEHTVVLRTVALDSLVSVTANRQALSI